MKFDAEAATGRVTRLLSVRAQFGLEGPAHACALTEIVSHCDTLFNGLELQF